VLTCGICADEKLEGFLAEGADGRHYCRDHEACNRRARKRLGVVAYERIPGRLGREGKRRLALCLASCTGYRSRLDMPTAVSVDRELELA
jgi:hypothetical protein